MDGFEGPGERQRALSAVSILTSALEGQHRPIPNTLCVVQTFPTSGRGLVILAKPGFPQLHGLPCTSPQLFQTLQSVSPGPGVPSSVSACSLLRLLRSHVHVSSKRSCESPGRSQVLISLTCPLPSIPMSAWDHPVPSLPALASPQPFPHLPQAFPGIPHLSRPVPPSVTHVQSGLNLASPVSSHRCSLFPGLCQAPPVCSNTPQMSTATPAYSILGVLHI